MLSPITVQKLLNVDPHLEIQITRNEFMRTGTTYSEIEHAVDHTRTHTVEDGIERIHLKPSHPSSSRALLMVHGMWHNAECWKAWQEWFAANGYESIAFSLPGHGRSPEQRDIRKCTLPYYLKFVRDEVERLNQTPVLFGHSMGGALLQWYLKYFGDLSAAIFVASWTSHDILKDSLSSAMKIDPLGNFLAPFLGWRYQFRNDELIRKWFLSENNIEAAKVLRHQLGPESEAVLMQHRPKFWTPPDSIDLPMLWLCADADAIIPQNRSRASAEYYGADFELIEGAGHDVMLDRAWEQSAALVRDWIERI